MKFLQEQSSSFPLENDSMFDPARELSLHIAWKDHFMTYTYVKIVWSAMQQDLMKGSNQGMYWIDDSDGTPSSYVRFIQIMFVRLLRYFKVPLLSPIPYKLFSSTAL